MIAFSAEQVRKLQIANSSGILCYLDTRDDDLQNCYGISV